MSVKSPVSAEMFDNDIKSKEIEPVVVRCMKTGICSGLFWSSEQQATNTVIS